ncbi:carbohydrate ABC transporter permease [Cellulosilyticum sp. I15G10I2]|uniref:carbohydrate ABC transporter permease n=1 Tax=Cellulosilyticum sp. I15G10I2 TaxID=1892843 RepID=UPI00085CBEF2|nr:carbohydrate ABC transporter permease [Cellulosilyticum sp. I15G10I2]
MPSCRNKYLLILFNIIASAIIAAPILYAFSLSLMSSAEMSQYPPQLISNQPTFENYKKALSMVPFGQFLINSSIVCILVTFGQIITCSLAAYAFAFFEFKGKKLLFIAVLATMMIPGEATIVSNYLTVSSFGWNDSLKVLVIPFLTSALGIFMIRQYYLTVPRDLEQAAAIDGCSKFLFLIKILMPISKPVMASLGIYAFINTWNQYMWPLLTINNPAKRTVQIGISMLQFSEGKNYEVILAGALMIIIPSVIIFIIGQKKLVDGMIAGAIKG